MPAAADDPVLVAALAVLVNRAYEVAEEGMWHDGVARTTDAEISEAIIGRELVLARDTTGRIVGSIRTRLLNQETGWFGVLAVDGRNGGQGIGGKLVADAESRAASAGARTMQLELLVPVRSHPHTDRLAAWYGRLGYREPGRLELADVEPSAVPFLAVPCNLAVMQKRLTASLG